MDNPEHSYHTIDPSTMYKYDHHTNIPWNMKEYQTPKMQVNIDLEINKRKWASQKKGQKSKHYVTKRGFYMDYELKVAKGIPSSIDHNYQKEWESSEMKRLSNKYKMDPKLIKYTYLQRIQMEQKNRKAPGVCAYSLEKSFKEQQVQLEKLQKKKESVGQKIFFYQNTQSLSDAVPGAGAHNPHPISPKERLNKTDYKFWVSKHKKEKQSFLAKQMKKPAPGTHNPLNTTLSTFEQLQKDLSKPNKKHFQGLDAKFEYTRQNKKKIIQTRPGPSSHSTIIEWKGKDTSPKKVIWNDLIWKGQSQNTQSIYH